ncbi:MAG TPA: hypothetical protein VH307_07025, partial [Streptosporangiaceae bacterium]|nr:hypothetical protein [Streptosporangiaceae bacterium]
EAGQPLLELRADDESRFARAREALASAVEIGAEPPARAPLVIERVSDDASAGRADQGPYRAPG